MDLTGIKKFWQDAGTHFTEIGLGTPTSRDPYLAELERENILSHLQASCSALEIGCGTASHSVHYAARLKHLVGVDVAESLIKRAFFHKNESACTNLELLEGSVLNLENIFASKKFDCVISQRCLINLPTWQDQKHALEILHGMLASGGLLLLSEGFQDGLEALNATRVQLGLPVIAVVACNRNFIKAEFEAFISGLFDVVEQKHYGEYLLLSRLLHPLAVFPEIPRHDAKINKAACQIARSVVLPETAKYSYNLFYALKKK